MPQNNTAPHTIENWKFSDYTDVYIPEIKAHLQGAHSGWLTLWSNQNELGRPVYHLSGFSPAYLPSWLIAQWTQDPWVFITSLSLLLCFLSGVFILLFCQEIALQPLSGLIAATSLATSPFFMYWLTFPMFLAIWCWAAGTLWAMTRLAQKMDLIAWGALSFSLYSLLITAYPQPVIFHAYVFIGYGFYLIHTKWQQGRAVIVRFIMLCVSAAIIAIALALPIYLDLIGIRAASARVAASPTFFTAVLPSFNHLMDIWRFMTLSTLPELFSNPIKASYPFVYDGLSITLLMLFFTVVSLFSAFKKTWGWWLVIFVCGLLAFIHPLYIIGVKHLGFNLSRSNPLGTMLLPLIIIAAYGVDALIKRPRLIKMSSTILWATAILLLTLASGVSFALYQRLHFSYSMLFIQLALIILLASQYKKNHPLILITVLIITTATISYPLILHQHPNKILKTSTFITTVRAHLAPNSRLAIISPGLSALPPNFNATLGLPSIHSYNSLSSTHYQYLIANLGGEVKTYGRWNNSILPDYNSTAFWMSNISLVLSPTKLHSKSLRYQTENAHVYFYKVTSRMGEALQCRLSPQVLRESTINIADPRTLMLYTPIKQLDQGDKLEFSVSATEPSLFILSQKFYPDWQAQALTASGWISVRTVLVNGVFQGVVLPKDTQRVRLRFKPDARFAWIAHIFWVLLLILLLLKHSFRAKSSTSKEVI